MSGFYIYGALALGTIIGILIGAVLRAGGEADAHDQHSRCADALATLRARVDRALAAETPGAAPAAKRLCRILRGEA